jgi:LPS export ABC transporter protein LptC
MRAGETLMAMATTFTKPTGPTRAVVAAAAAFALAALLAACADGSVEVQENGFRSLPADQVVFQLETDIKDLGILRARLHADTAHVWEDEARTVMFPVDLKLYDENGVQTAHLTAREGEMDTRTDKMVARGNVVLVSSQGDRQILTEELHYAPRTGQIWSEVHTVYIEGQARMEGEGFRADDRLNDVRVFKSTAENVPLGS